MASVQLQLIWREFGRSPKPSQGQSRIASFPKYNENKNHICERRVWKYKWNGAGKGLIIGGRDCNTLRRRVRIPLMYVRTIPVSCCRILVLLYRCIVVQSHSCSNLAPSLDQTNLGACIPCLLAPRFPRDAHINAYFEAFILHEEERFQAAYAHFHTRSQRSKITQHPQ